VDIKHSYCQVVNLIESWKKGFEYALREENMLLFSKMLLSECQQNGDYAKAAVARGDLNSFLYNTNSKI
jgi:hypothetical protein